MHRSGLPIAQVRRSPAICTLAVAALGAARVASTQTPDRDEARRAQALVRELELPGRAFDAARQLTGIGQAAIGPLRRALDDPRPEVVRMVLWTIAGIGGDRTELVAPVRTLLTHRDLGVALAARDAAVAVAGPMRTLLTNYPADAVIEIDGAGAVRTYADRPFAMCASRLPDGHLLVADYEANRVVELDAEEKIVWEQAGLANPSAAERLPNGHTLIADTSNQRAVEVDAKGEVVWSYTKDVRPIDVDRTPDGNTLVASFGCSGVIEITPGGELVWQLPTQNARDVDSLPDGTALATLTEEQRVVVIDRKGTVVREWKIDFAANDAQLLPTGNLLVGGEARIVELDPDGRVVWRHDVGYVGHLVRYGMRPATPQPAPVPAPAPAPVDGATGAGERGR